MQKLMDWLADEAKGAWPVIGYILLIALIDVSLVYTVESALTNWGIVPRPAFDPHPESPFKYFSFLTYTSILVQAPLFEETLFRFVPLTIVLFFTKRPGVVFTFVLLLAALFGALHPYSIISNVQVAIAGLVFGLIFLKCGGLQGRVLKGWFCSMAAHAMANLFLIGYEYYEYLDRIH